MHTHSFYRAHDNSVDMNRTRHREAIEHHRYRQIADIDHEPRHFPPESDYVGIEKTCDYKGEIDNNKSRYGLYKGEILTVFAFFIHNLIKQNVYGIDCPQATGNRTRLISYPDVRANLHHADSAINTTRNPYAGICRQSGILNILIYESNLLLKGFQVFFKMVDLALHVAQQGIAALRGNVKEAQIIFISLNFCTFLLKSTHKSLALTAETVAVALHLSDISGKSLHTGTLLSYVEMLVEIADNRTILFVDAILVSERNVAYRLPCILQFLDLGDCLVARGIVGEGLQCLDYLFLVLEILSLGTALA